MAISLKSNTLINGLGWTGALVIREDLGVGDPREGLGADEQS